MVERRGSLLGNLRRGSTSSGTVESSGSDAVPDDVSVASAASATSPEEESQDVGQDTANAILTGNPGAVTDFMGQVRSDPEFCVSLYKDCPRMQEVLGKNPDLKKIFEDPVKMRASFEHVYQQGGGEAAPGNWFEEAMDVDSVVTDVTEKRRKVAEKERERLLKDNAKPPNAMAAKALSGVMMVLKAKRVVTSLMSFASPTGALKQAMNFIHPDDFEGDIGGDVDGDGLDIDGLDGDSSEIDKAMARFQDPMVAEEIDRILEQPPEEMAMAIEDNEDLRALRDSNPLAAGMMGDPESFRVIMDPENLKACLELNDAMELDFMESVNDTAANLEAAGDAVEGADIEGGEVGLEGIEEVDENVSVAGDSVEEEERFMETPEEEIDVEREAEQEEDLSDEEDGEESGEEEDEDEEDGEEERDEDEEDEDGEENGEGAGG